jgi:hypothetical protein
MNAKSSVLMDIEWDLKGKQLNIRNTDAVKMCSSLKTALSRNRLMDTSSSLPIGIVDVTRERAELKTADPRGKMALPDKLKYIRLSFVEAVAVWFSAGVAAFDAGRADSSKRWLR